MAPFSPNRRRDLIELGIWLGVAGSYLAFHMPLINAYRNYKVSRSVWYGIITPSPGPGMKRYDAPQLDCVAYQILPSLTATMQRLVLSFEL